MALFDDLLGPISESGAGVAPRAPQGPSRGLFDDILGPGSSQATTPGLFDDLLGPPPSASQPQEEGFPWAQAAATGARVLFPIVGGAAIGAGTGGLGAMAGLAAGSAAGEVTGQAIERAAGLRPQGFEWQPVAGEAALGAAVGPLSHLRRVAQAGKTVSSLGRFGSRVPGLVAGAAEGALIGGASQAVQAGTREGRLPTAGELAMGVGAGGLLGGALGGLQRPAGQAAKLGTKTATAASTDDAARAPEAAFDDAARATRFVTPELFPGIRRPEGPIPQFSATMSGEESTDLFAKMAGRVGKGQPGLSIEPDPTGIPGFVNVVKRDADGNPIGVLEIVAQADETGALTGAVENANVAVARTRAAAGSAREMLLTAMKAGILPPEYAARAGAMGQTPSGARFANRFAKELEGILTGPPKPSTLGARPLGLEGKLGPEDLRGAGAGQAGAVDVGDIDEALLRDKLIRATAGDDDPVVIEGVKKAGQQVLDFLKQGVAEGKSVKEVLGSTPSGKALLRVNRAVNDLIRSGQVGELQGDALKRKYGPLSLLQGDEFAKASSAGGKILNINSQIAKLLRSDVIEEEIDTAQKLGMSSYFNDLLQLRRAGLVVPLPTAMRNVTSQSARYSIEALVDGFQGLMGDVKARDRALFAVQNVASPLKARARMRSIEEFTPEFAKQLRRFVATEGPQGGNIFGGRVNREKLINGMQWFNLHLNTGADDFIRHLSADNVVKSEMKSLGILDAFMKDPDGTLQGLDPNRLASILERATQKAQEVSFAEAPTGAFKVLSSLVERAPILTLATPFPRFMGSAFSFIKKHNPGGLLRAYTQDAASSPEALREIYSRATVGTMMLAGGLALKSQYFAGDKPLEFRDPESGRTYDLKSLLPLSFHIALADMILDMADGKKPGKIPWPEIREAALGIGRFSDAVPAAIQLLAGNDDLAGAQEYFETIAGDFLGGFTRPGLALRDALEGFYRYERSVDKRATQKGRLLGGFAAGLPFGGEMFDIPPVVNPATGKDVATTRPIKFMGVSVPAAVFRHLSGLNIKDRDEVESFLLKQQIDPYKRLQSARLGDDRLPGAEEATARERNLARTLMGPILAGMLAPRLERLKQGDEYEQKLGTSALVTRAATLARRQARAMMAREDPAASLTIRGSAPTNSRRELAKRDAARRRLSSVLGAPAQ